MHGSPPMEPPWSASNRLKHCMCTSLPGQSATYVSACCMQVGRNPTCHVAGTHLLELCDLLFGDTSANGARLVSTCCCYGFLVHANMRAAHGTVQLVGAGSETVISKVQVLRTFAQQRQAILLYKAVTCILHPPNLECSCTAMKCRFCWAESLSAQMLPTQARD